MNPKLEVTLLGFGDVTSELVGTAPSDDGLYWMTYDLHVDFADAPIDEPFDFSLIRRELRTGEFDETSDAHLGVAFGTTSCPFTAALTMPRNHSPRYVWWFDRPVLPEEPTPPFDADRLIQPWPAGSVSHGWPRTVVGRRYGLAWRW